PVHTGEVYINEHSMYERMHLEEVQNPVTDEKSWEPEFTLYTWYTCQDGDETVIYANFQDKDPTKENIEINVRRNCFYPEKTGVNYITLSGFDVKMAATTWAPPTAYQEGMIGPHWSKGWIIEDCEVSNSKCNGISLGKYLQPENDNKWSIKRMKHGTQTERDAILQAQREGWNKENIGSHVIRRCNIHHCEQTGIVGHLGGVFSIIEDNHIHHINNKQQLAGAEIGGIKMHAAIDVIFRRNHIHHCTRGLWLDWQAQGTRVTANYFHDNMPPLGTKLTMGLALGEDIFIEVSHGPTLIDNNLFLSTYTGRLSTQGVAYVHNLISGPFTSVGGGTNNAGTNEVRYTPYHVPHETDVAGFMTFLHGDDRFYNNIFIQNEVPKEFADFYKEFLHTEESTVAGLGAFAGYPTEDEYRAKFFVQGDGGLAEDRNKYYTHLPIYAAGNMYFNGAQPYEKERDYAVDAQNKVYAKVVKKEDGYGIETNVYEFLPDFNTGIISTQTLGEAFEPEQKFENPDGSEIIFSEDINGKRRAVHPLAGPFEERTAAQSWYMKGI
ncbi:MAG: right-handed parallel beta-helix repeat-containing protein, partial [Eubacteriales bacterium]|nr:right-handed parallel beta-helix repeat-containing protein [Eubacteriales bacterium]